MSPHCLSLTLLAVVLAGAGEAFAVLNRDLVSCPVAAGRGV